MKVVHVEVPHRCTCPVLDPVLENADYGSSPQSEMLKTMPIVYLSQSPLTCHVVSPLFLLFPWNHLGMLSLD